MRLAIIPARSGSKRIPYKNIREFGGQPMIHWPISVAKAVSLFDHVVVSTDSTEIAEVAKKAGAEVPFFRPEELADDHTGLRPVIKQAITAAEEYYGQEVSQACCILATAAFLLGDDLVAGSEFLLDPDVDFAFAATTYPSPIQRAMKLSTDGGVEMFQPEFRFTRSQDLVESFYDVGQFYWGKRDRFMDDSPMYSPRSRFVLIPQNRARDIDTPEDWTEAEMLLQLIQTSPSS